MNFRPEIARSARCFPLLVTLLATVAPLAACAPHAEESTNAGGPAGSTTQPTNTTLVRDGDGWFARPAAGMTGSYRARLSASGMRFSPTRPGMTVESAALELSAARVSRGGTDVAFESTTASVSGAIVRMVRDGVREELEAGDAGVEQRWRFESAPAGDGDVIVRVPTTGERFERESESGLHFVDPVTGMGVRYGHATWVDAAGHRTRVLAHFVAGAIVLRVPHGVVAASSWPCVLDPIVSAEFGMDMPIIGGTGAANRQINPSVAFDGTNYLAVWQDFRTSGFGDIYGARFTPSGTVLDANGIAITTAANRQAHPAIAFDGTNYLVVWEDARGSSLDIYGTRVSPAGTVLDPSGIVITSAAGNQVAPTVASNASNFLVAWEDARAGGADIYAARVSSAGAVLDSAPQIPISMAVAFEQTPAAASDGTNYLLVWTDFRTDSSGDVFGARVSSSGMVLDATGRAIYAGTGAQSAPAVTFASGSYFVAWQDDRAMPGVDNDIYAARVSSAGVVADATGIAVATGAAMQQNPSVGFNGTNYLVSWDDTTGSNPPDVRAARVNTTGVLQDATPIVISADPATSESDSAIGSGSAGYSVVVYDHIDATLRNDRIRARSVVGDAAAGQACTTAAGCASGFCVDGFCCNVACGNSDPSDCQACSVAAGGTADGVCSPLAATHMCRASAGVCDAVEMCTGTDPLCPADTFAPASSVCRAANGTCDAAEHCTGSSVTCPPDVLSPPGTTCRPVAGPCDTAEACDGSARDCPADSFLNGTVMCRAPAGVCDVPEYCTGTAAACPTDGFSFNNVCRASVGQCDQTEVCDGAHADCPANAFMSGVICRPTRGTCDTAESCDGTQPDCPADALAPAGTMCRAAMGACDVPETCSGTSATCPSNQFMPAGTECRPATGPCDTAEQCQAFNANCPPDQVYAPGFECRPAAGPCDVAEVCDGTNKQCPVDAFMNAGLLCRPSAGPCDVAESCDGMMGACPADRFAPTTQLCRASGGSCDPAENCSGTAAACPPNLFAAAGVRCSDNDVCSADDNCNGSGRCVGAAVTCGTGVSCSQTTCCETHAVDCDDHDPCTLDSCAPSGGCNHQALGSSECLTDAGAPDASRVDASVTDASGSDVASNDASVDVSSADVVGSSSDASEAGIDEGAAPRNGGCGCTVPAHGSHAPGSMALALTALGAIVTRRRYGRRA